MLLNLHVKNFALIEEADLELGDGLNILTGETGAGKSLLIDAVNAALGSRLRGDVIREGCRSANVELTFSVPEKGKREELEEMGVETEDGCLVLSRRILPGRSVLRINDETVTSAKIRAVTACLIDIHGQHEHQSLLHREKHREILDEYGGETIRTARERVAQAYEQDREAAAALAALTVDPEERLRRMDFLQFEIREIEEAQVRPGETEELSRTFRKMRNSRKICDGLQEAENFMNGDPSASDLISRAGRALAAIAPYDEELENLSRELSEVEDLVSSFGRELAGCREAMSFDPQEYEEIQDRLDLLHRLESKYGGSCEAILATQVKKKDELAGLEEMETRRAQAEVRARACRDELQEAADELTRRRRALIPALSEELSREIRELNFPTVDFTIDLGRLEHPGREGQDQVEFLISLNEGEKAKPLGEVASGGELSRIMLAIKAALAEKDDIPTLIFDEIDTGISGRTAQKVSEKLNLIARHRQVICITHLPQIAAMADHHYEIRKEAGGNHTITSVTALNEEDSVRELARLLGGAEITQAVLQNAREMKDLASRLKSERTSP